MTNPMYRTSCPPAIKGKITALISAAYEAAFIGAMHPEDRTSAQVGQDVARYNLEQTIVTYLDGRAKDADNS